MKKTKEQREQRSKEITDLKEKIETLAEAKIKHKKYSRLGSANLKVEVLDKGYAEIVPATLLDNSWLEFKYRGRKKKIIIQDEPRVMEWTSKFLFFNKRSRALIWHNDVNSMFTHNPQGGSINLKQIEVAIQSADVLIKQNIGSALARAVKGAKTLLDYIPWIAVTMITLAAFWVMNDMGGK